MAFQSGSFTLYHILKRTNNEEMSVIDNGTFFHTSYRAPICFKGMYKYRINYKYKSTK